jgi:AcrR family transcriptional regulator
MSRAAGTREAILATAERLFAQHGVGAVSNRQISDAAGQGNNTAVGYHFGTKTDLVRAIVRKHTAQVELLAADRLAQQDDGAGLRGWVSCLVLPLTDHLAAQEGSSWYARFCAQVMTDPVLRQVVLEDTMEARALQATIDGVGRCLSDLPPGVRAARSDMARHVLLHTCADGERAGQDPAGWSATAVLLIDAITGLLTAPSRSGH